MKFLNKSQQVIPLKPTACLNSNMFLQNYELLNSDSKVQILKALEFGSLSYISFEI